MSRYVWWFPVIALILLLDREEVGEAGWWSWELQPG